MTNLARDPGRPSELRWFDCAVRASRAVCARCLRPMLFDPASPGDARDAVRRLKHYYVHAQKGGGLSYLHREHLNASWTVWKFQTQAARATGVLKAFKNSAKNLRKDAKNMLRSWRALAWLGTLEGQAHSEMTLLRAKTFMSNVRRSIQLGLSLIHI